MVVVVYLVELPVLVGAVAQAPSVELEQLGI
jgi:hypothetical protein